ncbi:hypothetical protein V6N11_031478 [Hibiscus sabdariffa]|uniref:Uncharacterized protein n=1 Tax=Hibiscus sabdariffa TaxID=183260 RepID=A0ABR2SXR3_9ROSI
MGNFSCRQRDQVLAHYMILKEIVYSMQGRRVMASTMLGYLDLSVLNPLKRSLSSLYCIEDETKWPCTSKRFRGNSNDGGNLENATPPPLQQEQQQQAMLGSMGDGILGPPYQLPGSNCCN